MTTDRYPQNVPMYIPSEYALGETIDEDNATHLELGFKVRDEWIGYRLTPDAASELCIGLTRWLLDHADETP